MPDFDPKAFLAEDEEDFDPKAFLADEDDDATQTKFEPQGSVAQSLYEGVTEAPSIGERIPILGPLAAKAGTAFGAATMAPFSDKSFMQLYNEGIAEEEKKKAKYAEKFPVANFGQDVAAGMALPVPGASAAKVGASLGQKALAQTGDLASRAVLNYGIAEGDAALRGQEGSGDVAAGLTVAAGVLPPAVKGAGKFVRRFGFGVTDDVAQRYGQRASQINAESEAGLKKSIDDVINKIRGDVKQTKEAYDAAAGAAQTARQLEGLRLSQTQPTSEIANSVLDSARELRQKISQASSNAFDVLADTGPINIDKIKNEISKKLSDLKIGNADPILSQKEQFNKLSQVGDYLAELGGEASEIEPVNLKKFVQMLDAEIDSGFEAAKFGGYVDRGTRSLMDIRKSINNVLLETPGYGEIMRPLADDTRLLETINSRFKDERQSIQNLKRLQNPEMRTDREAIQSLGEKTNKDLIGDLGEYEAARNILKNPVELEKYMASLPQSQRTAELLKLYEAAKTKAEPFKGLSQRNSQNFLRGVMSERRPNIETKNTLDLLGKEAGQNFSERAKDLAVKNALDRGFTQGSRNVNLGAFSLGGAGGLVAGGVGQLFGQTLGSMAGAAADIVGPKTYKKFIDLSLTPAFQKFANILNNAAQRGPFALAIAHQNLMNANADYKSLMEDTQGE